MSDKIRGRLKQWGVDLGCSRFFLSVPLPPAALEVQLDISTAPGLSGAGGGHQRCNSFSLQMQYIILTFF